MKSFNSDEPLPEHARGLTETCLAVLAIAILISSSYWVLQPFLPALIWAVMIVISTWPLLLKLQEALGDRRELASTLLVLLLFLTFIVPLLIAMGTILDNVDRITAWISTTAEFERPAPPDWFSSIPLIGPKLVEKWTLISSSNKDDIIAKVSPYMGRLVTWFAAQIGNMGLLFLHFLLTLALTLVMYLQGERVAKRVRQFSRRLAGERGEEAAILAAKSIRAVALGVVGTAIVQSMIASLGFLICGVPQVMLLTALVFFFSVVQIGAVPVMLPVVGWLFVSDQVPYAVLMLIWSVCVGVLDNVLRPFLIKRGANLPLLLIFSGVVGGLIAFGIIGLFVGPVVLAVSYTLLIAWIQGAEDRTTAEA